MRAFDKGHEIEVKYAHTEGWQVEEHPEWNWSDFSYRIATGKRVLAQKYTTRLIFNKPSFYSEVEMYRSIATSAFIAGWEAKEKS